MKRVLFIFCAFVFFQCGGNLTEPNYPEAEVEYITIYQNDNPIEFTPPQTQTVLNGIFALMVCRNKSDSVWYGHPEMKLEDANNRGFFEKTYSGYLTTDFNIATLTPVDTVYAIQAGKRMEAWIFCPHNWSEISSVIPWISFVTDN